MLHWNDFLDRGFSSASVSAWSSKATLLSLKKGKVYNFKQALNIIKMANMKLRLNL